MDKKKSHLHQIYCPDHPDACLIQDYRAGDLICPECGLVVGDRVIDVGSEWRTFSKDKDSKDMSRVGDAQNPLLSGSDLSTIIEKPSGPPGSSDSSGFAHFNNRRTMSNSDRTLIHAFREIASMCDRINLTTNIKERANKLFKQVYESKFLRGRSNDAISAACLYIACRQEGVPRTFKEVCAISRISKKEISRSFKLIVKKMETNVEVITSGDFMSRFCSNLGLPAVVQRAATCIAKQAVDQDLVSGRSPISVAAAAIYMASQASKEKKSQKEISEVAGVAEVTIRQSYKQMLPNASKLFPSGFCFYIPPESLPSF